MNKQVRLVSLTGKQLDYCIYQCFTTTMSTMDIYSVISKSLLATAMLRFEIIAIVGDGAQCNRQFQNRFFCKTVKSTNMKTYEEVMVHRVTMKPIFYISDPSHMVKKIVSSLSSNNRNIFMNVANHEYQLSLSSMMVLWMSFNNNSGLNQHQDFKMTDFVKNSFQAMRVGPCIKVHPFFLCLMDLINNLFIKIKERYFLI